MKKEHSNTYIWCWEGVLVLHIMKRLRGYYYTQLLYYTSMAEDIVEVQSLEKSFAINVKPVVPPGT